MPSNLTWWQARDYAVAGTPVRREQDINPMHWITHTTGLFYLHEESNTAISGYVVGDPVPHIVRNAEFGPGDFLANNWTTLHPGESDPVPPPGTPAPVPPAGPPDTPPSVPDPTPGGYPPSLPALPEPTAPSSGSGGGTSGGSGGSAGGTPSLPTGGNGGGGVIVVNPPTLPPGGDPHRPPPPQPFPPADPFTPPHWDVPSLIALLGSGPALDVQGALTGGSIGLTWSCTAYINPPHALAMVLGTSTGVTGSGPVSHTDPPITVAQAGDIVHFVAVLFGGPASARDLKIVAQKTVA